MIKKKAGILKNTAGRIRGCVLTILFTSVFLQTTAAATPVDPLATSNTCKLLAYLENLPSRTEKRVIAGQFLGFFCWWGDVDEEIYQKTGKYPGLIGLDYGMWGGACDGNDFSRINAKAINHWNNGGLVQIMGFWNNPATGTWGGVADLNQVVTTGTALNTAWKTELDRVARGLGELQNLDIPIIFNAFTEMNNTGDRWWSHDVTGFKNLWIYTFNYLTATKGIHNLLWTFAPAQWCSPEYYPGDQYVDMAGQSFYGDGSSARLSLSCYSGFISSWHKVFALTEFGPCGPSGCTSPVDFTALISDIKTSYPSIVYWMDWNGTWGMPYHSNVAQVLNDPWVLTRGEISLGGVVSTVSTPTITPNGGSFIDSVRVSLSTSTAGAEIRYTTDGSTPTAASTVYSSPFPLTASTTVKALGTMSGLNNSGIASATFTKVTGVGNLALNRTVTYSSSFESGGWGAAMAVDGNRTSSVTSKGWSSSNSTGSNHTEWITVDVGVSFILGQVDLYPRDDGADLGYGFPIDFTIQVSPNGTDWTTVVTQTGYARPQTAGAQQFTFTPTAGRYVKITGTGLRSNPNDADQYRMQFAEIEIFSSSTGVDYPAWETPAWRGGERFTYSLINLSGQTVYEQAAVWSGAVRLSTAGLPDALPPGIYFVRLHTGNSAGPAAAVVKKMIKIN